MLSRNKVLHIFLQYIYIYIFCYWDWVKYPSYSHECPVPMFQHRWPVITDHVPVPETTCEKLLVREAVTPYDTIRPSILQSSIIRPPFIIRPLDLVPKGNLLCLSFNLYFKTTCNIRPHFLGPMGGLKIEVLVSHILRHTLLHCNSRPHIFLPFLGPSVVKFSLALK